MTDDFISEIELDTPVAEPPPPVHNRRRRGWPLWVFGVAGGMLAALGLGYRYLHTPAPPQPPPAAAAPVERAPAARGSVPSEEIPLPPLDETDPLVRELVGRLSSHPAVAAWLATDGLLSNFAVVTRQIANGETPVPELRAIGPVPAFQPRTSRGDLFLDPSSYRRYDRYAQAVSALDARGTARLYTTLEPRISDAYRRVGEPSGDFDPVLERAIVELLNVPIVQGEIELVPSGIVYAFADPRLEGLSAAQKQVLRMGPQHTRAIQEKLREIADYLGIPASRLPR